ncbi:SPW repeat protein [Streptomyces sp. NPDC006265]|uniref:SPW repeat protein n=1 Tax=Streptomyces sp. NPDC006265 TaxID=3156740 RepID=UPI0033BA0288
MTSQTSPGIAEHPDILALRARSERAASTPAAQAVEGLSLLTGLYLAASPWIVGFNGLTTLTVNNLIAGIAFTLLAVGFGSAFERTHGMSWAALGVGIWTVIAPWVVAGAVDTTSTVWSNVVTGAVAIVLALATSAVGSKADRR